jgi:hypothetical protein
MSFVILLVAIGRRGLGWLKTGSDRTVDAAGVDGTVLTGDVVTAEGLAA